MSKGGMRLTSCGNNLVQLSLQIKQEVLDDLEVS